jgi:hypothetical protein
MRDLGTFVITYPCWAIVHKHSIVRDANNKPIAYTSPIQFMVIDDNKGGTTFPVFTDADLADRYLKASDNSEDFKIVAVTSPQMLASALKACRGIADAMSLDQPKLFSKPYAIWPLEYAIQKIEAGEQL